MLSSVYYTKTNIFSFLEDFISESWYFQNFTKTLIRKKKNNIKKHILWHRTTFLESLFFKQHKKQTREMSWNYYK